MNDGNLVPEGKYFDFNDAGSVSSKIFDACVEVIEHQGASNIELFFSTLHNCNNIEIWPVSNKSLSGRIAFAASKFCSVFREHPLTLMW